MNPMNDDKLREIIESLPEKRSRSRLEPYRQLIAELRRLRRTYREIASVLGEKCQVQVSATAVHNFVRLHLRRMRSPSRKQTPEFVETPRGHGAAPTDRRRVQNIRTGTRLPSGSDEEVRQRIEELKRKPAPAETPVVFHYDPSEPLHLLPKTGKKTQGS
jgi:hypothetical protein